MEPYNKFLIDRFFKSCCGECAVSVRTNTFKDITFIDSASMNHSQFVFPVLGRLSAIRLYGYYFIPIMDPPTHYYITAKDELVVLHLMSACLQMWPILIISLGMVMIAGFLGWIMETWVNQDEFPREFLIGWFEGFWWSFVSMTTVGYGDKTPKSLPARLFSVVWILVGITTFCVITAMLTNVVMRANTPPPPHLVGARVGALRHRVYDACLIAEKGGILIDSHAKNDEEGIFKLIQLLQARKIDGFILDRYTYIIFMGSSRNLKSKDSKIKLAIDYINERTIKTEQKIESKKLSFGMLVKNKEDFEYFAEFARDNREVINACTGLMINMNSAYIKVTRSQNILFSKEYFWPSFAVVSVILGSICFFGAVYEIFRRMEDGKKSGAIIFQDIL